VPIGHSPEASGAAIVVQDVSKRFRNRGSGEPSRPGRLWSRAFGRRADGDEGHDDDDAEEAPVDGPAAATGDVWALRQISFEVPEAGSLALVGPPGSGKTTLLKVLARITIPTEGRVVLRGRIAPLIGSLQSFLQRDADARTNIRFLASLFGFPPRISERELRTILDFAEVSSLVGTRLGGYSAGQQARLAYSTFLHLPSDILVVDGAILPRDVDFSERCLEQIEDRVQGGAALVIAPHDLEIANRLCAEAIWLEGGRVRSHDATQHVIAEVRRELNEARRSRAKRRTDRRGQGDRPKIAVELGIYGENGRPTERIGLGQPAVFRMKFQSPQARWAASCGISLTRADGAAVRVAQPEPVQLVAPGAFASTVTLPPDSLASGSYVARGKVFLTREGEKRLSGTSESVDFDVTGSSNSTRPQPDGFTEGARVIQGRWTFSSPDGAIMRHS
jgi:ABC-type polysaccharide/polyol phosphate transport system ATPase subunit